MEIYNYDSTGLYLSKGYADEDPLSPGEYLIPANATAVALPEVGESQIAKFANGVWVIVPDLRGTKYWLNDVEREITEPGVDLPEGAVLEKPASVINKEFADYKKSQLGKIAAFAESARQQIAGKPTALKASAWSSKEARARRIVDGVADAADIALVQAEADHRGKGETAAELAEKQLAKAQTLLHAVSVIDGMESRVVAAVQEATDATAIDSMMAAMRVEADAAYEMLQ